MHGNPASAFSSLQPRKTPQSRLKKELFAAHCDGLIKNLNPTGEDLKRTKRANSFTYLYFIPSIMFKQQNYFLLTPNVLYNLP